MKMDFGRCQVYKLNISTCLTEQEQEYYNLFCDGISQKELKERLDVQYPTPELISEEFHITLEKANELLCLQFEKKEFKKLLLNEIAKFSVDSVRQIKKSAIYVSDEEGNLTDKIKENKKIVWFENECVRRCNIDLSDIPVLDQFLLLKCGSEVLTDVLQQIIDRGVDFNDKHYLFYTSSTGQMKEKTITLVEENYWIENKYALMCGLTEEHINSSGGINMGKFFSAKALNISNSIQYDSGVNIDEVIIVPDFSTMVSGMVNYLDVDTLDIEEKKMDIKIEHMDGAGIFMPGTFPCSCQIRGGWLKGAVFPFDFHKFIEKYRDELSVVHMKDAWGSPVTVDEFLNAKMILTDSQLKMRKYYTSMQEYRECFKKAGLSITINNCAHQPASEVKVAYQPFQTIPRKNLTDEAIEQLAKKTVDYINNAKKDPKVALKLMGIELESEDEKNSYENVELNALHAAILKYPQMLNDIHVQKTMKSALMSARKEAQGCKLILDGFWSYICPDLFAFCQWLFLGQDVPDGLIPEGYIYNHYYDGMDIKETCCLRYPHLSDCEHGIRKVMQSEECKEWFIGTDTIVSSHDLISKALQADWDGDHICLVHDEAFLRVLDRKKYPLFYDMTKAEPAQITNKAIMMCLISSFHNENIGFVSNTITKIFNSEDDPDTKLVRILCAYNNFVIDYFKTQKSMDLKQYASVYEKYKDSTNSSCEYKCPHFFMYAKDKKTKQCEKYNKKSNADRISQYVKNNTADGITKVEYSVEETFSPEILKDTSIKINRKSKQYENLRILLSELERERMLLYKKVKEDLKSKESDKQIFNVYCRSKFKEIISYKKKLVNYLLDIEYFTEEFKDKKKDIIWNCYGDILYDNICKNVDDGFILKIRRNIYQSSKKREKQIAASRDKVKKEQEDIVKIPITQTLYDYFMDATTRGGCENDKYILYIIYVLIERYKKKYGSENEYVRIYKGLKQKGKITPATIDKWFGGKITAKALDRLEKYKYIKREQRERYDKIYLCDIPTEEASEAQFMAESFNPLLDLWESNGDRKVGKCEICGKKFVVVGNSKTCSVKCSKILVKKNKNKQ